MLTGATMGNPHDGLLLEQAVEHGLVFVGTQVARNLRVASADVSVLVRWTHLLATTK